MFQKDGKKIISFPKLTGPYGVGSVAFHWADEERKQHYKFDDDLIKNKGDYLGSFADIPDQANLEKYGRELLVQFWYPSEKKGNSLQRYDAVARKILKLDCYDGCPTPEIEKDLDCFDEIYTHAQSGASIALNQQKYPVLIFSHGYADPRVNNSALCEELASYGYIVVGVEHTYASAITRFPDGRVTGLKFPGSPDGWRETYQMGIDDVTFVLNELERINEVQKEKMFKHNTAGNIIFHSEENMFKGKLDLSAIGVFGHSLGGTIASFSCAYDERLKAAINLDGPFYYRDSCISPKTKKPHMFITMATFLDRFIKSSGTRSLFGFEQQELENAISVFCDKYASEHYIKMLKDSGHNSVSDKVIIQHLSAVKRAQKEYDTGSIDSEKAVVAASGVIRLFFDAFLKREKDNLSEVISKKHGDLFR